MDRLIHRIQGEGRGIVCWCTEENWGINGATAEAGPEIQKEKGRKKRNKRKKKKAKPYRAAGGGGNWRDYLDEWD